ncbi:dynein regulatory complex subunit 2-like isoform X2 [Opisthocomus hoazin]|uniref:dynein regulatory complex subunit 2-like isoform X2 n=1 Tax=Opisthocomus hoazin TaxID=30419 RepID=UPI003F5310FE
MLTRFLKDKLAEEERSSALNLRKFRTQWRAVLREAKAEELRQDVEILSQTFARAMDCKDGVIESLAADLEQAEEQHGRALHSHLHNIDRLLQLQRCRLSCLEQGYGAQLEALMAEFEAERRSILEQHERESCCLRDVALAAQQNHAKKDREATLRFQSARDDIRNKSLQEKQHSRLQLDGRAERLWERFQSAMQSYAEATEHQKMAYEALKEKDKKSSREIETQAKKLRKLQAQRILRLAEMCRRLETEEEKVLPFYASSLAEGEQRDARRVLEETPAEPLAQAARDYVGLERFWQRFSKAKLEERALERERAALSRQNRHLRELLRHCLAVISVGPRVLAEPNPHLAVTHKS